MLQRFKHIKSTKKRLADGTTRTHYYHRKTGKKILGDPGTPEFAASYALASEHNSNRAKPGTIHWLVERYLKSSQFSNLQPRTQKDYRNQTDSILMAFGNAPMEVFEDKRVRINIDQWRQDIAKTSLRRSDYALSVLSTILTYGVRSGYLNQNAAKDLGKLYKSRRTDNVWNDADIQSFLQFATPEMALALRLALDTAQRQGDLIRLAWTQFDGSGITLRQNKTAQHVYVPCTDLLRAELNRTPRKAITILTGQRGRPWTADGFRSQWYKVAKQAGVHGRLTFNDLRGTAVTRLAEAGCEIPEIAAISGHSVDDVAQIIETYMARTNRLASNAIAKLEASRRKNG